MADKVAGGIKAGSTSVSYTFVLRLAADGTETTGKAAAAMTASYWRQGGTRTAITLSDLAAVDAVYSAGGVKEVDATNMPGLYRLDLPDAAVATGADWVDVAVKVSGSFVFHERIPLETKGAAEVFTVAAAVKTITDQLTFPAANKVAAMLQASADFPQAAADKVWASAARSLTTFGTLVADVATAVWGAATRLLSVSVWDEADTHNTAGTTGAKLIAAASAGDPWSTAIPGAYTAGQAGFKLASLGDNTASITAIKAKTDQIVFTTPGRVDASAAIDASFFTVPMTESYAADGVAPSLAQALFLMMSLLGETELNIPARTLTCRKVNGTDTAAVFQLDQIPSPTTITRIG